MLNNWNWNQMLPLLMSHEGPKMATTCCPFYLKSLVFHLLELLCKICTARAISLRADKARTLVELGKATRQNYFHSFGRIRFVKIENKITSTLLGIPTDVNYLSFNTNALHKMQPTFLESLCIYMSQFLLTNWICLDAQNLDIPIQSSRHLLSHSKSYVFNHSEESIPAMEHISSLILQQDHLNATRVNASTSASGTSESSWNFGSQRMSIGHFSLNPSLCSETAQTTVVKQSAKWCCYVQFGSLEDNLISAKLISLINGRIRPSETPSTPSVCRELPNFSKVLLHCDTTKLQSMNQPKQDGRVIVQEKSACCFCFDRGVDRNLCCLYRFTRQLTRPDDSGITTGMPETKKMERKCFQSNGIQAPIGLLTRPRIKRSFSADSIEQFDPQIAQPRNLQIVPYRFGAFNISWTPSPEAKRWVTHYELVLIPLGQQSTQDEISRCSTYLRNYNVTPNSVMLPNRISTEMQITINVTASASQTIVAGLPPDRFYRILLFAMSGERRSLSASMPSSPRVPSLPPLTPPKELRVTSRGTQEAKVSWKPSNYANCTGELINYVIFLNSTRLLEPMMIKLDGNVRSHVIKDLIPGTHYTVQVAASTRGGLGVPTEPVHFRTGGELPEIELDDNEDGSKPFLPDELDEATTLLDSFEDDESVGSRWTTVRLDNRVHPQLFLIPAKIQNLRATSDATSIHLKWSVALRRIKPNLEFELLRLSADEIGTTQTKGQPLRVHLATAENTEEQVGYLPPGTKYIIRWGDLHPGPAEDIVSGDQTEYLIRNLRPGTIYYIRVIAVTRLGDGPAAYTVAMTHNLDAGDPKLTTIETVIPMNLVVLTVGPTWARVGWELPEQPSSLTSQSLRFQLKYYPINEDRSRQIPLHLASSDRVVSTVNVTIPWTEQVAKQPRQFKTMLRGLKPATQYEFGVCLLQDPVSTSAWRRSKVPLEDSCWSMVQGFETIGQTPADAPRNVHVSVSGVNSTLKPPGTTTNQMTSVIAHPYASEGNGQNSHGVRVHWDPPSQPNGNILAYIIYWTTSRQKPIMEWLEHTSQGTTRQADLVRLEPSQVYFLRMIARNRHGDSPFSKVVAFRTADVYGRGGGMIRLSKEYHDPREINEPLDQILDDSHFKYDSEVKGGANENKTDAFAKEQFRWIIVGCVLGATVVILLIATAVLFRRWRKLRHSLGIVKKFQVKPQYITSYPNVTGSQANPYPNHPNLSANNMCVGSYNLSGRLAGASHIGPTGGHTSSDVSSGHQPVHNCPKQNLMPTQFGCLEHCVPGRSVSHCTHPSPPMTQLTCSCRSNVDGGPSNFWGSPPGFVASCVEDRQSTPAGSENGGAGSFTGGSGQMEILGRNSSKRMCDPPGCFGHGPEKSDGYKCPNSVSCSNCGDWNQSANENSARTMTMSFLANSQHPVSRAHSDRCDAGHCKPNYFVTSQANQYPVGNYPDGHGDCSPDCGAMQRHHNSNMTGGFTGSGSLIEDEAIASSPASSSAGPFYTSTPPNQGNTRIKWDSVLHPHQMNHCHAGKGDISLTPCNFGQSRTHIRFYDGQRDRKVSSTRCHTDRGPFGMATQEGNNVLSSDYASQQSSLSNKSSASSATGHRCSPERPPSETRAAQVGLSFALDRVPTPEPTPRPAPFSRLAAGIFNQQQSLLQTMPSVDNSAMSPSILKKAKFLTTPSIIEANKDDDTLDLKNPSEFLYVASGKELSREYSAEELSQEMANLEGLMKDLNKITQCQFDC